MKECITHHNACDCREQHFADAIRAVERAQFVRDESPAQLRQQFGELTHDEIRLARLLARFVLDRADE